MKIYITESALWLLAIIYAPLVIALLWALWRRLPARAITRVFVIPVLLAIAIAIPLGDVLNTSMKMAGLCPQAGLFVKRSVSVEGFYTNLGTPDMLDRGFKYIEASKPGDRIVVYLKGGEPLTYDSRNYQVKSRYEFVYDEQAGSYQGSRHIGIQRSSVRDRQTAEELGYALRFKAYPGWLDRNTFGLVGKIMWVCHQQPDQEGLLLRQALLPSK